MQALLVDDGVKAFEMEYDHTSHKAPKESLRRLAKHFHIDYPEFYKSWDHLQQAKESYWGILGCLSVERVVQLAMGHSTAGLVPKAWDRAGPLGHMTPDGAMGNRIGPVRQRPSLTDRQTDRQTD